MRWFTMWLNLLCTSAMVSTLSILNISYSWIRACFLALFTSVVPPCVTSRISYISFAEAYCETLQKSSEFRAYVVPSRIRALTKSKSKSTAGVKVNARRRLGGETPRGSVAKARRRLGQGVAQPGRRQIKQCKNKAITVWFPDTHG